MNAKPFANSSVNQHHKGTVHIFQKITGLKRLQNVKSRHVLQCEMRFVIANRVPLSATIGVLSPPTKSQLSNCSEVASDA